MNKGRIEADVTRSIQKIEAVSIVEILRVSVIDSRRSRRLLKISQPTSASTTAVNTGPTTNEVLPVRLLDGEVKRLGDIAFTGGTHCEVWRGEWVKGGDVEEVRLRIIMSTPLTWPFVGGFENTSST